MSSSSVAVQVFSYISLVAISALLIPQAVHNYRRSTTDGMSPAMIWLWLIGSIIPAAYLLYTNQPIVLTISWFIFCFNAIVILCQVHFYSQRTALATVRTTASLEPEPEPELTSEPPQLPPSSPSISLRPLQFRFVFHFILYSIVSFGSIFALYYIFQAASTSSSASWIPDVVGGVIPPITIAIGFLPQFFLVWRTKSTAGMSLMLIAIDFCGCISAIISLSLNQFDIAAVAPYLVILAFQSVSLTLIFIIYPTKRNPTVDKMTMKGIELQERELDNLKETQIQLQEKVLALQEMQNCKEGEVSDGQSKVSDS